MVEVQRRIGKRAAKATIRHSARGAVSKVRRRPLRSATLLGIGGALGAAAGFTAARLAPPRIVSAK